ncbi:MAG TPA: diphthine--ammonia ligase [Bacteroidia bacterium]|nr:diphthine--ammonia ligase [Bacteroidia bacterium]
MSQVPSPKSLPKTIFCWSGGKDSALCLYKVLLEKEYEVKYLLTTLNENFKRVSMHGVREDLLEKQAEAIGIPLIKMYVREGSNEEYAKNMEQILLKLKEEEGITHCIFGDIFLEDLREYREDNLQKVGFSAVFPLWKHDTKELMKEFISLGFKTITCCVNDAYLSEEWCGKNIDEKFIAELPATVDPCGENGEFHTFCYAGPVFKKEISFSTGEKIYRPLELKTSDEKIATKGFWYCDLELLVISD